MTLMQNGQSMVAIDQMDFFFYFDCLIYEAKKKNKKTTEEYDRNGF